MRIPERVGVIAHARRPESIPVAEHIVSSLQQHGVATWFSKHWDATSLETVQKQTDMVVAIGGDGAMLRAARNCARYNVPVLGVNMGYLGFLPEINAPEAWDAHLERLMMGDYWVEQRMMLEASITRKDKIIAVGSALNDIVINRNRAVGTVLLQTYIDGFWATTYHADALIVATATGSTAYALAADGPILPPELRNILIVPVAPHLSMDRPLVLSEGATVQVIVSPEREHHMTVVNDGMELCDINALDRVDIRAGRDKGLLVRMRDRHYFYRSLLDRMEPRAPSRAKPQQTQIPLIPRYPPPDSNKA